MNVRITPQPLMGSVRAISSKSDAHRCLIAAALCNAPTQVRLSDTNEDIEATRACLEALGAHIHRQPWGFDVTPIEKTSGAPLLDCGESGSTLRFLLPLAAALGESITFTGHGRLPQRPLSPLTEQMQKNGCTLSAPTLPFTLTGRLTPGVYTLAGDVSSQFVSGLLFALPLLERESRIQLLSTLESRPYVEMTIQTLARFGIAIQTCENAFTVPGGQVYRSPSNMQVEGDWSSAAFFLCAGALGETVSAQGLSLDSLQADKALSDILTRFGATVTAGETRVQVSPASLHAAEVDVSQCPDLFPLCAVLAAVAQGESRLTGAKRLRLKESDRIRSVVLMLRALGADVQEQENGLTVRGGALKGGVVDSTGDHRIAMAAAIASIRCAQPVTVLGAECCAKSYPTFFEDFTALGGNVHVV